MNLKKAPRKLLVIIIDDLSQPLPKEKQQFFLIKRVDDYLTAQDLMLEFRQSYGEWGGDLFLVDVDFRLSEFPPNLEWGEFDELRPFGPLLALPFLGKEVCAFIPYSSYWGDQHVKNNGFVLIATSMLLAAAKQEFVKVNDVKRMIEAFQDENSFAAVTEFALNDALGNYRNVLETSSRIQLIDVGRTIRRLEALEENMTDLGIALPFPLQDAEGVLSIDFAYPPYHFDSIELSSIFADLLNYSQPDKLGAFQPVFEVLERWRAKPSSVERGGNLLTEAARKVLNLTEGSSDNDESQMLLDAAIDKVMKESDLLEEHQLKRIVMEFAWVKAWYEEKWDQRGRPAPVKQQPLNDEETELEVAALNPVTQTEKVPLITRVHISLALNKVNSPANRYRRLLCQTVQGVDRVSDKKWRTPFKTEYDGVNDAYQLDKDEPSALPPFEKAMCIQYALDELRWDGSEVPYPRWMTE